MNLTIERTKPSTWFLPIFFAVVFLLLMSRFNHFLVPDSDFFDFAEKAIKLRQLQWPDNFKRPPLYPILMAGVSLLIPGKYAELYAAEFIGLISALFSFYFLWRIASRLMPQAAAWVLWLWAFHPLTVRMALKPKPEILVTCLILWAFERYLHNDKRAYAIAALASMVRYEGALVIGAFFVADFIWSPHKWRTILIAALSSMFIIGWSLIHTGDATAGEGYGYYFTNYRFNFEFPYRYFADIVNFLPQRFFVLWFALAIGGMIGGVIALWRKLYQFALAALLYLVAYWVLHIIWPFCNSDYIVMASWIGLLFIVYGWQVFLKEGWRYANSKQWIKTAMGAFKYQIPFYLLAAGILALAVAKVVFISAPLNQRQWIWVLWYLLPLAFHHWPQKYNLGAVINFIFMLMIIFLLSSRLYAFLAQDLYYLYYAKAEFRLVGEWYQNNYRPGDRLLMAQPNIAEYYTSLSADDFVPLSQAPTYPPQQFVEWLKEQGITRVAYLKYNLKSDEDVPWSKWVAKNRNLDSISFLKDCKDFPGLRCEAILRTGPRWAYIYRVD